MKEHVEYHKDSTRSFGFFWILFYIVISISRIFQQALYHVLDSILVALTSYYYISKRALGAHAPHGAIWCLGIQQFLLLPLLSVQLPVRPLFVKFFLCESTKITKIQSESLLFQPKTWGNLHTPRLFWRCHAYYYNLHQVRTILFYTYSTIAVQWLLVCINFCNIFFDTYLSPFDLFKFEWKKAFENNFSDMQINNQIEILIILIKQVY